MLCKWPALLSTCVNSTLDKVPFEFPFVTIYGNAQQAAEDFMLVGALETLYVFSPRENKAENRRVWEREREREREREGPGTTWLLVA